MDTRISVNGNFTEFEGRSYILFTCPYLPPNGALHIATYTIYDSLTVGGRKVENKKCCLKWEDAPSEMT